MSLQLLTDHDLGVVSPDPGEPWQLLSTVRHQRRSLHTIGSAARASIAAQVEVWRRQRSRVRRGAV